MLESQIVESLEERPRELNKSSTALLSSKGPLNISPYWSNFCAIWRWLVAHPDFLLSPSSVQVEAQDVGALGASLPLE